MNGDEVSGRYSDSVFQVFFAIAAAVGIYRKKTIPAVEGNAPRAGGELQRNTRDRAY